MTKNKVEKKHSPQTNPRIVISASEAAEMIGVHEQTIRLMCKKGTFKYVKIGERMFLNRRAFMLYFGEDFFHTEFDSTGHGSEDCYRIPKYAFKLMSEKKLTANAVLMYAMLSYRLETCQNAFYDENDNQYVVLTTKDIAKALCISATSASCELDALERAGLICRVQRKIYVLDPPEEEAGLC